MLTITEVLLHEENQSFKMTNCEFTIKWAEFVGLVLACGTRDLKGTKGDYNHLLGRKVLGQLAPVQDPPLPW